MRGAGEYVSVTARPSWLKALKQLQQQQQQGGGESLFKSLIKEENEACSTTGALVSGFVTGASSAGVFVALASGVTARIPLSKTSDSYTPMGKGVLAAFHPGKIVTGRVLSTDAVLGKVELSLKKRDVLGASSSSSSKATPQQGSARVLGYGDLAPGMAFSGIVTKVADFGVFISLEGTDRFLGSDATRNKSGGAPVVPISGLCHISETFDPPPEKEGKGAQARKKAKIERGTLSDTYAPGDKVRTVIVSYESNTNGTGVGGKLSLSLRPSKLSVSRDAYSLLSGYAEEGMEDGDNDQEGDEEEEEDEEEDEEEEEEEEDDEEKEEDEDEEEEDEDEEEEDEDEDEELEESEDEEDEGSPTLSAVPQRGIFSLLDKKGKGTSTNPRASDESKPVSGNEGVWSLKSLSTPFSTGLVKLEGEDEDGLSGEEEEEDRDERKGSDKSSRKSRSLRAATRAATEAETQRLESRIARAAAGSSTGAALADSSPDTVADCERGVTASPHTAEPWIRYMAWHSQRGDLAGARSISARALATVRPREETERLALWTAWLNLEAGAGDQKACENVFERAATGGACDPRALHLAMIGVLDRSSVGGVAFLESVCARTAKRFGKGDPKTGAGGLEIWLTWAECRAKRGDGDGARELLKRATTSLPAPLHAEALLKFALLEYRWAGEGGAGSRERGRTMLEKLTSTFPKRLDIWSVYLDQECAAYSREWKGVKSPTQAQLQEREGVRTLFRRVSGLKHSTKKMKFLLKKWQSWELLWGDAKGLKEMKAVAKAYVESASGEVDDDVQEGP